MATKIIKQGSEGSSRVRRFAFSGNLGEEEQDLSAQPFSTPYPLGPSPSPPKNKLMAANPPVPAVDLAQVEKSAYESGFRQGEKTGLEIAEKKVDAIMRRYSETLQELGKLRVGLYAQVEREVVKLALEVAKKIVHREIQADKEIIQTLVKVALGHVAEKTAVTVHLNPVDYNFILERKAELSQSDHGVREIVLLADRSIERGGCLVKTECGDIDARIEEKFREVERVFFEGIS